MLDMKAVISSQREITKKIHVLLVNDSEYSDIQKISPLYLFLSTCISNPVLKLNLKRTNRVRFNYDRYFSSLSLLILLSLVSVIRLCTLSPLVAT